MDPEDKALLRQLLTLVLALSGEQPLPSDLSAEPVKFDTWKYAKNSWLYLDDPTLGLTNAYDQRLDILGAVGLLQINTAEPHPATLTDILAAFGDIPVYTLPETPPAGYGGTVIGEILAWQLCALD